MPELATSGNAFDKRRFSRRGFLGAGIASGFALAACASKPTASVHADQPHVRVELP